MSVKTHLTATVVIPPLQVWGPIQAIRQRYDRQFRRWMPHVTMLYPFLPADRFDELTPLIRQALGGIEPFEVTLAEFRWFSHGQRRHTLWLAPQPAERLSQVHEALFRVIPECDDVRRFGSRFTPHLSVGQAGSKGELDNMLNELRCDWQPVHFLVRHVSLIRRNNPPDDVFQVDRIIKLGR